MEHQHLNYHAVAAAEDYPDRPIARIKAASLRVILLAVYIGVVSSLHFTPRFNQTNPDGLAVQ